MASTAASATGSASWFAASAAPLVGRISMDHAMLDVTEIPGVEAGDEVVILGTQGSETITAYEHADATGTIPWEVFTRIAARVRRIAV